MRRAVCETMHMTQTFPRRRFLKVVVAASPLPFSAHLAAAAVARATAASTASEEGAGLTVYELGPQVWIRYNNRPLTCYRAHRSQKYPYFFPLSGPVSGLSLTHETTLPYPHLRSLFFGCDRVNGGNYLQEGYETGQILSTGPRVGTATKELVVITD